MCVVPNTGEQRKLRLIRQRLVESGRTFEQADKIAKWLFVRNRKRKLAVEGEG